MSVSSLPSALSSKKPVQGSDILEAVGRTRGIYATAIQIPDLMGFVAIINVLPLLDAVARTFLAYRLVELGEARDSFYYHICTPNPRFSSLPQASDSFFGMGTSLASLFAFGAMLYGGGALDRWALRTSVLTFMVLDASAFIVMAVPKVPLQSVHRSLPGSPHSAVLLADDHLADHYGGCICATLHPFQALRSCGQHVGQEGSGGECECSHRSPQGEAPPP